MPGTLYIVPTPIGNLEDITLRALRVLKEVDAVVCEDTRRTVKLLNHFEIHKPLVSFYTHNQARRVPEIIQDILSGRNLALVSDGGTPGVSDPGYLLIREALAQNANVVSLPGACAAVTALVASGLPSDDFIFLGFLPRKPGKMKNVVREAAALGATIVLYESPYRLIKTLGVLSTILPPETPAVVGRELTKKFEEYVRGTLASVAGALSGKEILGEVVLMLSPLENKDRDHEEN